MQLWLHMPALLDPEQASLNISATVDSRAGPNGALPAA
jgi:hypothetical protein